MVVDIRAESLMSDRYATIDIDAPLTQAFGKLNEVPVVLAFERGKLKGIVARRHIMRSGLEITESKVHHVVKSTSQIDPDTPFPELVRLIVSNDTLYLPVVRDEVLGVIDAGEVLRMIETTDHARRSIQEIMTHDVFCVHENERIGKVLFDMKWNQVSRLPILSRGTLVGIVTVHDLAEALYQPRERQKEGHIMAERTGIYDLPVSNVMVRTVHTLHPNDSVADAIRIMLTHDVNSVIITEADVIVGILTRKDILESFPILEGEEQVYVQVSTKDDGIDREAVLDEGLAFANKYSEMMGSGTLAIHVKRHKEVFRKMPLIFTRIRLVTERVRLNASGEGWGIEQSLKNVLGKLEEQLIAEREKGRHIPGRRFSQFIDMEDVS